MAGKSEDGDDSVQPYKKVAHGAFLILAGTAIGHALGFLARILPARLLGPDEYGLLVLGFTILSTVVILPLMGLPLGLARSIPRRESRQHKRGLVLSAAVMSVPASVLLSIIIFSSADSLSDVIFNEPRLTPVLKVFSLALPLLAVQEIAVSAFRGYNQAKERVIIKNIVNPLLRAVLIPGAIVIGMGVLGAAAGWAIGIAIAAIYSIYLLKRSTQILHWEIFPGHYKMLLTFSLPLLVANSMGPVLNYADNILLGYFLTSTEIGTYDAAFTLGKLVTAGMAGFGFLFLPIFSGLHSEGNVEEMDRLYKVVTKWAVSLILPVFLVITLFPDLLLSSLFGVNFSIGSDSLIIVATGFFINVLVGFCGQSLISMGYTRFVMAGNLGTAILNILLNAALIPLFGIAGAAAASSVSYATVNILYLFRLFNETGIHPFTSEMTRAVFYSVGVIFIIRIALRATLEVKFWMLPLIFLLFVVVYGFLFLRFGGLEEEDVDILLAVERRSGVDLSRVKRFVIRFGNLELGEDLD